MSNQTLIFVLAGATFILVIGWAAWQKYRVKKSQERSGDPDGKKATHDALHAHKNGR